MAKLGEKFLILTEYPSAVEVASPKMDAESGSALAVAKFEATTNRKPGKK
ncbi:unannotated protein [freshwater metagenome]|uniref:Unannotated protein n=1 Tax=freshwater metagenome TaxID=449393 RepID=A0A6J7EXY4_9ZZZZ|nr:hypothetical protein [Actinomycetota bacterium]